MPWGTETYQWDANGHPTVIDSASNQTYDALGNMVELSQPGWLAQYLYDDTGYFLGESHAQAAASIDIPLPGGGKASYSGGSLAHYRHVDWLGTGRFDSTSSQTLFADVARAPYGEEYAIDGAPFEPFAGLTQSIEADLFDTNFREYHPTQGRWISPDPAGLAAVDMTNPQTWNRYAYVANNPLNHTDRLGLNEDACNPDEEDCGGGGGGGGTYSLGSAMPVAAAAALAVESMATEFPGTLALAMSCRQILLVPGSKPRRLRTSRRLIRPLPKPML
jgi:RHS repeat-associated protein